MDSTRFLPFTHDPRYVVGYDDGGPKGDINTEVVFRVEPDGTFTMVRVRHVQRLTPPPRA